MKPKQAASLCRARGAPGRHTAATRGGGAGTAWVAAEGAQEGEGRAAS